MKRFRLLDSGESTTTAERARRDLHYERRGRRRRQSHKRHCVQHRSPRSSSVGDVNNIEMDFGRPGGRPLMLIHAQPVCAVSLGHPEDPDLELGGSVLYTNLGGYGALIASTQVLARKLSVWSWDLLAVGQAPSAEGRLGPDFLPTFQATRCQPAVGVKCIRVTLGFRSRVSKTVAVTVLLFRTGAKLTSTV